MINLPHKLTLQATPLTSQPPTHTLVPALPGTPTPLKPSPVIKEVLPLPAPDHIRRIRTRHHNIIFGTIRRGNRPAPTAHGAPALRPGPVDRRVQVHRGVEVVLAEVQLGGQEVGLAVAGSVVERVAVVGLALRPVP